MKEIRTVSAAAVLRAMSAGKNGPELMRQFGLSEKEFNTVVDLLLAERQRRAVQIVADWRSGLTLLQIADKNGFSVERFPNIFQKLEALGFLHDDNFKADGGNRCKKCTFPGRRAFPRLHHPVLTTRVYDTAVPQKTGLLLDLSERGLGVSGIESQVGQEKVMFMHVGDFLDNEALTFECRCRWISAYDASQRGPSAGFEITSVSGNSLRRLRTMLAAEISLTRVA